jgi:hypothetical protein
MKKPLLLRSAVFGILAATAAIAQTPAAPKINFPALSPSATVNQKVGLGEITIEYSRPSVKGREIFGKLEPYGTVWRTGANSATKITFSIPVKIGGTELPAGSYALLSIPDPQEWTLIFNRATGDWGAYSYKQENDVLRVKAKPVKLPELVETFTIDVNELRPESATLNLIWEKTRVPVKLEFATVKDVVAQIDAAMASGAELKPGVYFAAAQFYYENGLDLNKAKPWIEQATKGDKPPFYMLYWKAKILAKMGDKAGATAAAQASIAGADGPAKAEYVRLNEAVLATLK